MAKARGKLYRPKPLERIEVVWRDAQYDTDYDGDPASYKPTLAECSDMGYFVGRTKDAFTLAACVDFKARTTRWHMSIPVGNVISVRSLEPVQGAA